MEWVARGQDTVTIFLGIMIEATPFLVLGVLVSQALALVVREGEMVSWVPRGRLASLSALAGLGALFPVCECGNVPVARRLLSRGVPVAAAMVFLLSAPALNPVVALSTYAAFRDQPSIVVLRLLLTFVVAIGVFDQLVYGSFLLTGYQIRADIMHRTLDLRDRGFLAVTPRRRLRSVSPQ